jgi:hypothetical protein
MTKSVLSVAHLSAPLQSGLLRLLKLLPSSKSLAKDVDRQVIETPVKLSAFTPITDPRSRSAR